MPKFNNLAEDQGQISEAAKASTTRHVFWLSDHPDCCAFPAGFPHRQWHRAASVPDYSGGPAPELSCLAPGSVSSNRGGLSGLPGGYAIT
jgi:hypothetical protein